MFWQVEQRRRKLVVIFLFTCLLCSAVGKKVMLLLNCSCFGVYVRILICFLTLFLLWWRCVTSLGTWFSSACATSITGSRDQIRTVRANSSGTELLKMDVSGSLALSARLTWERIMPATQFNFFASERVETDPYIQLYLVYKEQASPGRLARECRNKCHSLAWCKSVPATNRQPHNNHLHIVEYIFHWNMPDSEAQWPIPA